MTAGAPQLDHALFRDADRRRAYEDLVARPSGAYREWAERWHWTLGRVQRFILTLEREGIIKCRRSRWGTTIYPIRGRYTPDTEVEGPPDSDPSRKRYGAENGTDTEPTRLGTNGLTTGLGSRPSARSNSEPTNYTSSCIATMNEQLGRLYGDRADYRPVRFDNRGAEKTCAEWQAAGIELEFAIEEIRKKCLQFNPGKHGGGKLPENLKYFRRSVLEAHARRDQTAIALPPVVQRGGATRAPPHKPSEPAPLGATVMDVFRETARAGGRRRL